MLRIYKRLLPTWGAYLTHSGEISLPRLGDFLGELGRIEERMFLDRRQAQQRGDPKAVGGHFREVELQDEGPSRRDREQQQLEDAEFSAHAARHGVGFGSAHEAALAERGGPGGFETGAVLTGSRGAQEGGKGGGDGWKWEYYKAKLDLEPDDGAGLQGLILKYVEGVCWCYYYYYRGCVSWNWFYPHHYAPLASDLDQRRLAPLQIKFQLGTPFQPFQQLLAVLPRQSARLLPPQYAELMQPGKSAIAASYPDRFETDMDGKNWEWEAVVLIPFIDEGLLFSETARVDASSLTEQHLSRNKLGLNKRYTWDGRATPTMSAEVEAPPMGSSLPPLVSSRVKWSLEDFRPFPPDHPQFEPVLSPGVRTCPGYPSLFSRPLHVPVLSKANIDVFGRRSRRESLCLRFADSVPFSSAISVKRGAFADVKATAPNPATASPEGAERVASMILGSRCFVSWPYWRPALITAVTTGEKRISKNAQGGLNVRMLSAAERSEHQETVQSQHSSWLHKAAVDICGVDTLVEVKVVAGMEETLRGARQCTYEPQPLIVAAQTMTADAELDPRFQNEAPPPLAARFSPHQVVILMGEGQCLGTVAAVIPSSPEKETQAAASDGASVRPGHIAVRVIDMGEERDEEEFGKRVLERAETVTKWFDERYVASVLGLSGYATSRILSSFMLPVSATTRGEMVDIGLSVKFERRGMYTAGYARKVRSRVKLLTGKYGE